MKHPRPRNLHKPRNPYQKQTPTPTKLLLEDPFRGLVINGPTGSIEASMHYLTTLGGDVNVPRNNRNTPATMALGYLASVCVDTTAPQRLIEEMVAAMACIINNSDDPDGVAVTTKDAFDIAIKISEYDRQ